MNYLNYIRKYQVGTGEEGILPRFETRNGIMYMITKDNPYGLVVGEVPVSGTDPIGELVVEGAVLGKPFELGLKGLGLLGKAGWKGLSRVAPKTTSAVETGIKTAGNTIKQGIAKLNPFKKSVQITSENASKITPEEWDIAYNEAIKSGDKEEILRLRDLHFQAKAPETKTTGTYANNSRFGQDFTVFDRNKIAGPNPETGYMFDPQTGEFVGTYNPEGRGFFFRPEEFDQLVEKGERHYKLNITNPRTSYTERTIVDNLLKPDQFGNSQFVPKTNNGIITKEIINGKEVPFEVLAMQPEQIKLADAITYDNSGKVIPLSKRDNFSNPDIRYMLALPVAGTGIIGSQRKSGGKLNYLNYVDRTI